MEIQESVLLRRVGRMDPVSVPEFEALGGFSGIRKALSMEKEEILEEISRSNLKLSLIHISLSSPFLYAPEKSQRHPRLS